MLDFMGCGEVRTSWRHENASHDDAAGDCPDANSSGRALAQADMHSLRPSQQAGAVLASRQALVLAWGEQPSRQAMPLLLAVWVDGPAPVMHER